MQRAGAMALAVAVVAAITIVLGRAVGAAAVLAIDVFIAIVLYSWVNNQGLLALRSAGAMRIHRSEHERLWNVVEGLAADLSVKVPALFVIDKGGPNALACIARGPALAVRRSLLEEFTRTELEAVVAHALARFVTSDVDRATLGISFGPLWNKGVPRVGYADDVRAASITRYPPALAAAVDKAEPVGDRFAPLWFVGEGRAHRPPAERAAALRDL